MTKLTSESTEARDAFRKKGAKMLISNDVKMPYREYYALSAAVGEASPTHATYAMCKYKLRGAAPVAV